MLGKPSGQYRPDPKRAQATPVGGDVLSRYWNDDERHLELDQYSPLRMVVQKNGGTPAESEGAPLENGG